jgi:hypothetical protein
MRTAAVSLSTGRVAHDGDRIVLQYWYFYYDDVYSYPFAPTGAFWQAHEGDWEVVNVVLSEDEEPLSVGYSQHSLGQTRSWDDTLRFDGTHPIVHVALSSHANYFTAGLHTFNQACVPLPVPARDGSVMPIHQIGDDGRTGWVPRLLVRAAVLPRPGADRFAGSW